MDYSQIILDYVRHRKKPPNHFVAILCNDLYGAVFLCCEDTSELREIIQRVHTYVPSEARGSIHAVEQWIGHTL